MFKLGVSLGMYMYMYVCMRSSILKPSLKKLSKLHVQKSFSSAPIVRWWKVIDIHYMLQVYEIILHDIEYLHLERSDP